MSCFVLCLSCLINKAVTCLCIFYDEMFYWSLWKLDTFSESLCVADLTFSVLCRSLVEDREGMRRNGLSDPEEVGDWRSDRLYSGGPLSTAAQKVLAVLQAHSRRCQRSIDNHRQSESGFLSWDGWDVWQQL